MMENRIKIIFLALVTALLHIKGAPAQEETVGERPIEHLSIFTDGLDQAWRNPALLPLRFSSSLTRAGVDAIIASDYAGGYFSASSYQRLPSAVVTGSARYDNGQYRKGRIYETDDTDIVGPYLLFASGPGTLNKECYAFGGSYTAMVGAWNVGVSGSYEAGLSYRTVDPRPKNITGLLTVTPAGAFRLGERYVMTAAATYIKYKQTNSLKFVSELGQNTIYHMTGLANTYGRFEGSGASTYYTGHSLGGEIGLMPQENGAYLFAAFGRMKITNILSDYNNLPLARTSTPNFIFSAGWKDSRLIAGIKGRIERRRGTENIFGDPVSGQYPRIGALTLYSRTVCALGLTVRLRRRSSVWGTDAGWESLFEQHLSPSRLLEHQRFTVAVIYQYQHILPKGGYFGVKTALTSSSPMHKKITGLTAASEELMPVVEAAERIFNIYASWRVYGNVETEMLFPINGERMLGGSVAYSHGAESTTRINIGVKFLF